ncbi:uncharacterized protein LOC116182875 [Photinus pyralis]|uniref:uncharacterized protein LOC116182875 n=1 Tax=Photinus pyralis TaxID=7054 RepID=UPI0012676169|nr:uncharacterized protein LOC116182875 [Photinus pyralis]
MDKATGRNVTKDKGELRIVQVNVNNSARATDLAYAAAESREAKLIILAEPNKKHRGRHVYASKERNASIVNVKGGSVVWNFTSGHNHAMVQVGQTTVVSAYISPNSTMEEFEDTLDEIARNIRKKTEVIIGGDFNAKNPMWGGQTNDERGVKLAEWAHQLGMTIMNDGKRPTCIRHNGCSYIDLTIATAGVAKKLSEWEVTEEETLSDHELIYYKIENTEVETKRGWEMNIALDRVKIGNAMETRWHQEGRPSEPEEITKILATVQKKAIRKQRDEIGMGRPYWWTERVEETKSEANRKRRKLLRSRKSGQSQPELESIYREARRKLRAEIAQEKRAKWRDLCSELSNDPFGQAYRIVARALKMPDPRVELTADQKQGEFERLFVHEGTEGEEQEDDSLSAGRRRN